MGSGAAGGVLARELSQAGFSVVVLEQGPRLTLADFEHDELKYWFNAGLTNDVVKNPQTFRDDRSKRGERNLVRPSLYYARTVGGSSTHYTANYWRFHEVDFDERSRLGPIAGTGFADWPISYAELEPYYTKVEWEIGVSGLAGASPFDPPRSKPYPMPPLPVKSSGVLLERGARKLGLHPFPAPMAINSQPYRGRPACVHCGFCHGFGCEVGAKASTLTTMIPEAEATGRCEVRSESYVVQVVTDKRGRATGVRYFDRDKRERFQKAKAVIVSANGAETPRLLLMSANSMFPQGLANSSGLVGKYLMFNYNARTHAVFEHELNEFKSVQCSRVVHDFYDSDPKRGFYGGGGIDSRMGPQPTVWADRIGDDTGALWGSAYKARLAEFPRMMQLASHTHVARAGDQQRRAGSRAEGRLGHARDARHVQGSSGRSRDGALPAGARRGNHGGGRRGQGDECADQAVDELRCTCWARAAWATTRRSRWSIAITARTTSRTCSCATAAAS